MSGNRRTFRTSQLISPFGPGAIVDIGEESLIMNGTDQWPSKLERIELKRLTEATGVFHLKKAPPVVRDSHDGLWASRFPAWLFCSRCRKLEYRKATDEAVNADGVPVCMNAACKDRTLVPMRFVAACNHGHLQDIPWDKWAHKKSGGTCMEGSDSRAQLYFESKSGEGSGLDALKVTCRNPGCGSSQSLGSIMAPGSVPGSCLSKQPYEYRETLTSCNETLRVLQRGASNLYYGIIKSALDIPISSCSETDPLIEKIKQNSEYEDLLDAERRNKAKRAEAIASEIAETLGTDTESVLKAIRGKNTEKREFKIPRDEDIRKAEWQILTSEDPASFSWPLFKARVQQQPSGSPSELRKLIKRVVLIDKLREVRAFCGFERIKPDGKIIAATTTRDERKWLPATEVFGEGIFIEFSSTQIRDWEDRNHGQLTRRLENIKAKHASLNSLYLPDPSAKFIALHTFAHILIRQLTFESGYSASSLRERIYAFDEDQAGIMIYTADGDSEGSLGGLVQQGEYHRLYAAIESAVETAQWCSNDPVCSEADTQGVMEMNKAACHSCSLISETGCEYNNLLLDRALLTGNDEGLEGLLSPVAATQEDVK